MESLGRLVHIAGYFHIIADVIPGGILVCNLQDPFLIGHDQNNFRPFSHAFLGAIGVGSGINAAACAAAGAALIG